MSESQFNNGQYSYAWTNSRSSNLTAKYHQQNICDQSKVTNTPHTTPIIINTFACNLRSLPTLIENLLSFLSHSYYTHILDCMLISSFSLGNYFRSFDWPRRLACAMRAWVRHVQLGHCYHHCSVFLSLFLSFFLFFLTIFSYAFSHTKVWQPSLSSYNL